MKENFPGTTMPATEVRLSDKNFEKNPETAFFLKDFPDSILITKLSDMETEDLQIIDYVLNKTGANIGFFGAFEEESKEDGKDISEVEELLSLLTSKTDYDAKVKIATKIRELI